MCASSEYLERLKISGGVERGVKFDLLLTLDFYDGPERGFAFYSSGEGLSFSVIAEAKYPILRAFALTLLKGDWTELIKNIHNTHNTKRKPNSRLVFAYQDDSEVMALLDSVSRAPEQAYYVGVGQAYLENLAVAAILNSASNERTDLRGVNYTAIHRYIKHVESMRNGRRASSGRGPR
jgi:hypothetical protein